MLNDRRSEDVEHAYNESKLKSDTTGKSTADETSIAARINEGTTDRADGRGNEERTIARTTTISFDPSTEAHTGNTTLYIPGPRARDHGETNINNQFVPSQLTIQGQPIVARNHSEDQHYDESDDGKPSSSPTPSDLSNTLQKTGSSPYEA